jgi:cyclophilin family peptidyl-prolyl cis-trans isomerase
MNETKKDMIILGIVFLLILGAVIFVASKKQSNQGSVSVNSRDSLTLGSAGYDGSESNELGTDDVRAVDLPDDLSGEPSPSQPNPTSTNQSNKTSKTYNTSPQMQLKQGANYQAVLKTSKGDIKVDLFEEQTPITVNNFVFLSKEKFYDNTKFHRIINGFMIQGGDPEGTGRGGPGYQFDDEPFTGEYEPGALAMANAGPNTNGSQFFIMHKSTSLPKQYVIFGKVADEQSMSVVDTIANTPTKMNEFGTEKSTPTENVVINTIEIIEN